MGLYHVSVYPHRATTSAAILAGGQARRFDGRDKSRLVVDGQTIIIRQLDVLQQVASEIFVVSGFGERFADLGLPVYPDRIPGLGAIGGLHTALESAHGDFVLAIACDLPFLTAGLLGRLVELAADADGAWIRWDRGVEPLIACYRRSARAAVAAAIEAGQLKASDLNRVLRMAELDGPDLARFGPPERLLANVNSPDDLARLR